MVVEWRHFSKALLVRGNMGPEGECVGKSVKLVKSKKKRKEKWKKCKIQAPLYILKSGFQISMFHG